MENTVIERVKAALVAELTGSGAYFRGPLEKFDEASDDMVMTTKYCVDGDIDLAALARAALKAARERDDLLMALIWLVGLHDEKPADASEQWPIAWNAARTAISAAVAGVPAND